MTVAVIGAGTMGNGIAHCFAQYGFPVILVGKAFWSEMVDFKKMIEFGVIDENDMQALHFVETAQEAWQIISKWYQLS